MYHRNSRGSLDLNYGISMELIPRPHILLLHPSSHHLPTVDRPPPSKKDGSTSSPQHTCPSLDKKHSLPYNFLPSIRTVCHQLPQGNTLVLCFSTRIHAEVHDAREQECVQAPSWHGDARTGSGHHILGQRHIPALYSFYGLLCGGIPPL